ncbi:MAG: hypothetical protein ABJK37_10445 [Paraglaciecola sp.]|uniref:YybH family protein n=1 Tax=Paraglaciecola sp. TaxID=1920173 RepID=UPI003297C17B
MKILMNRYTIVSRNLVMIFISLILSTTGVNAGNPVLNADIKQTLSPKRVSYMQAMLDENTQELLTQYSVDTRLMPEAHPTIFGKQNAQRFFEALFSRFDIQRYEKSAIDFIPIANDIIVESGEFELTMLNPTGQKRVLAGSYANLWRQQNQFEWLIETDIWNFHQWIDFKDELTFDHIPSVVTALGPRIPLDNDLAIEVAAYQVLNKDAVLEGDAGILVETYGEKARLYPNYHSALTGKKAIKKYWLKHMAELPTFSMLQNRTDKIEEYGKYIIQYASHIAAYRSISQHIVTRLHQG